MPWVLVGVLSVGGAVTAGLTAWKAPRQSPADNAVVGAAQALVAAGTATLRFGGTETVASRALPISGSARLDLAHHDGDISLGVSLLGQHITERIIQIGSVSYLQIGGALPGSTLAKSWIVVRQAELKQLGVSNIGGGSVLGQVPDLLQSGNSVNDLGPASVRGQRVEAYKVTLGAAALGGGGGQTTIGNVSVGRAYETLYVSQNGELTRVDAHLSVGASGLSEDVALRADYSHFGEPVHIAAPASKHIISFRRYLQLLEGASRPRD